MRMTGITAVFMNGAGCTLPFACIKIVQGSRTACLWPCVTNAIVGKRQGGEVLFLLHLPFFPLL